MENNLVIKSTNNKENAYYTGEWDTIDIDKKEKRIDILLDNYIIDSYAYYKVKEINLNGNKINIL